jgi:hypothetical protein
MKSKKGTFTVRSYTVPCIPEEERGKKIKNKNEMKINNISIGTGR